MAMGFDISIFEMTTQDELKNYIYNYNRNR